MIITVNIFNVFNKVVLSLNINFELYKVFYHSALYLNFSEAGKKLFVSQSAISQSIKQLETQLGVTLFFRNKKRITLTPQGQDLFSYIEKAFILIKSGERNIQIQTEKQKKELRIAASDTICKYYLLPYFKDFNKENPEVTLKIVNRTSPVCIELLEKGEIDLAIVNLPEKYNKYTTMNINIIKEIQDIFIAGKLFSKLSKKKLSLQELTNYPLLLLEKNSTTRIFFDNLLKAHDISVNAELEIENMDLLVELTKIGLGISFVIYEAAADDIALDNLFPINLIEKIPPRYLGLLSNKGLPLSESAENFMNLLV